MLKFIFILIGFFFFLTIRAQQVTNIRVTQEGDNVVITYDVTSDKAGQTFDIKVECSADNGKTFSILPKALSGDLKGITAGTTKNIIWDVLSERQELTGDQFVFQLVATVKKPADSYSGNSGTFTDPRDGHVYKWVKIGNQIWMAENLAYLPAVSPLSDHSDILIPKYNVYDYEGSSISKAKETNNYNKYGVLYSWQAAKESCPNGWHLPSNSEWNMLINYLGGVEVAGGKMKSRTGWKIQNTGATNSSGFSGIPAGVVIGKIVGFRALGESTEWWSSTETNDNGDTGYVWCHRLNNLLSIESYGSYKSIGASLRCVKD